MNQWIYGINDSEGCEWVNKRTNGTSEKVYHSPRMCLSNANVAVLDKIRGILNPDFNIREYTNKRGVCNIFLNSQPDIARFKSGKRKMNWDYIAGFIDGEGCWAINKGYVRPQLTIHVSKQRERLVCKKIAGFLSQYGIRSHFYNGKHGDVYFMVFVKQADKLLRYLEGRLVRYAV